MARCKRYTSGSSNRKRAYKKSLVNKHEISRRSYKKNHIANKIKNVILSPRALEPEEKGQENTKFSGNWVTELVYRFIARVANLYRMYSSGWNNKIPKSTADRYTMPSSSKDRRNNTSNLKKKNSKIQARCPSVSEDRRTSVSNFKNHRKTLRSPSVPKASTKRKVDHRSSLEDVKSYLYRGFEEGRKQAASVVHKALDYGIRSGVIEPADHRGMFRVLQPYWSEDNITAPGRRVRFQTPSRESVTRTRSREIKCDSREDRRKRRQGIPPEDLGLDDDYSRPRVSANPEDRRKERLQRQRVRQSSSLYPCRSRMSWARKPGTSCSTKSSLRFSSVRPGTCNGQKSRSNSRDSTRRRSKSNGRATTSRKSRSKSRRGKLNCEYCGNVVKLPDSTFKYGRDIARSKSLPKKKGDEHSKLKKVQEIIKRYARRSSESSNNSSCDSDASGTPRRFTYYKPSVKKRTSTNCQKTRSRSSRNNKKKRR